LIFCHTILNRSQSTREAFDVRIQVIFPGLGEKGGERHWTWKGKWKKDSGTDSKVVMDKLEVLQC
jgi:hypothetical protein